MKLRSLAVDYLRKARIRREASQLFFDRGAYDDVVREAQEIVELCLKGGLRGIGVDPPKQHDVGDLLRQFEGRWPSEVRTRLTDLEMISKKLFEERGHAFYGDETAGVPSSALFTEEEGRQVLQWTDQALAFLEVVLKKKSQQKS